MNKLSDFKFSAEIVETVFALKESIPGFQLSMLFKRTIHIFAGQNGLKCDDSNPLSIKLGDAIIHTFEDNDEIIFVRVKGNLSTCEKIKKSIMESKTLFALPVYEILSCKDDIDKNESTFDVALFTADLYNKVIVTHQNPDIEEMREFLKEKFN